MYAYGAPPKRQKGRFVAPALMVLFGVLSACVAHREYAHIRDNPTPTKVVCSEGALERTAVGTWVSMEGCVVGWEGSIDVYDDSSEMILAPLLSTGGENVGFVRFDDPSVFEKVADLRLAETETQFEAARLELSTVMSRRPDVIGGTVNRLGSDEGLDRFSADLRSGAHVLRHGDTPNADLVWFGCIAAGVLFVLAPIFTVRAIRQRRAEQEAIEAWHAQMRAQAPWGAHPRGW